MNLKLIPTPEFKKSAKRLAKKYKLLSKDLATLEKELTDNAHAGIELSHNCFKIRVKSSSIPTGKSGGFRVIYYHIIEDKIYLLDIYSKSELSNIEESRLLEILEGNGLE